VIVSEELNHRMQVFDLTQLLTLNVSDLPKTFSNTARYTKLGWCHNVFVNEDSGFAYAVGCDKCSGGLSMIDMSNPRKPKKCRLLFQGWLYS